MKAFRYITALGLGAAISLDLIAPPTAQAQTTDTAESQQGLVATSLIPGAISEEAKDEEKVVTQKVAIATQAEFPPSELNASKPEQVALGSPESAPSNPLDFKPMGESVTGLVSLALDSPGASPQAATPDFTPVAESVAGLVSLSTTIGAQPPTVVAQATVAQTTEPETSEPEGLSQPETVPVESDPSDPIEQEFLNEPENLPEVTPTGDPEATSTSEAEEEEEDSPPPQGVVTSAPDGTTLIDEQPELFRPEDIETVGVDATLDISLERAIEIAVENNPLIRIRQLQVEQAQAAVRQQKAALFPQLSLGAQLQQSGSAQGTTEVDEEPALPFTAEQNDSRQNTTSLNSTLSLNYNIIEPGRRASIRAAEKQVEQAELQLNQDLSQLRLDVSNDYYAVQEADEQVLISQGAVDSAAKSLQDAQALERAGVGTKFAVLQAEVQLANEEQNRINALSNQQQTRRALSSRLSIPENFNVSSGDTVQAAPLWEPTLEQSIIMAYRSRVELDNELLNREISDAQREVALAGGRPTFGVTAQVGSNLNVNFSETNQEGTTSPIATTGVVSTSRTENFNYQIGLNFNWNFFTGGAGKAAARQQEIAKAIAEAQFENLRDTIRQQVETAFYQIQSNFENITTAKKGVQQAVDALRLARLRFQAGVGTQTEVVDAERDLTTARGNEVTAILNYNRALVQMRRAVGETLDAPAYESPVYVRPVSN